MKTFIKNILIVFFVLLVISSIFTIYNSSYNSPEEIPLNQVVYLINKDGVEKITIQENKLEILLKDETQKISRKEGELGLSETLKNLGVNADKLQKINFEIKEESGAMYWLNIILPFLLPFLLIGIFIWIMFKQAQKGQAQALSFGKSNAKLNQPEKGKKITFKDVAGIEEAKEE